MNNSISMTITNIKEPIGINVEDENNNIEFEIKNNTSGTKDYDKLSNKPMINSIELKNNKSSEDLGLQPKGDYAEERITNLEIDALFN
ncbi:MAG: hypothetical protein MJ200_05330 [Mycoplasmoidaceae bacterium]|nr:hypothetical protein [Mycoplasmoidaceae bacterium]